MNDFSAKNTQRMNTTEKNETTKNTEPGEQFDFAHDLLVEQPVGGVEADPLDGVHLVVQLVFYLQSWKPSTISIRLDFLKCVQIFIFFQNANLYRKCV